MKQSKQEVRAGKRRRGRHRAALGTAGWLVLLLGALALVVWRQTRGAALERGLRELESERQVVEAERVELVRRIQALGSRARIVRVARERLEMRLPADGEIVFLPVPREAAAGSLREPK